MMKFPLHPTTFKQHKHNPHETPFIQTDNASSSLCIWRQIKTERTDDNIDSKQNPCLNGQLQSSSVLCNHLLHLHAHLTSLPPSSPPRLFTSSCLTSLSRFLSLLPCVSYFLLFNPLHSVFHSFSISIPLHSFLSLSPQRGTLLQHSSYLAFSDCVILFFSLGKRSLVLSSLCSDFPVFIVAILLFTSLFVPKEEKTHTHTHTHTLCKGAAGHFRYTQ